MGDEKPVADLIAESLALERATADMGAALKIARQAQALADAQGSPAEIRDDPQVQAVYFGTGKTFEAAR